MPDILILFEPKRAVVRATNVCWITVLGFKRLAKKGDYIHDMYIPEGITLMRSPPFVRVTASVHQIYVDIYFSISLYGMFSGICMKWLFLELMYASELHCPNPAAMRGERGERTGTYSRI